MKFWAIFKKELKQFFTIPSTYLVISVFLLLSGYFFYTNLLKFDLFNLTENMDLVENMWYETFEDIRLILTLVLPLFTMKLFSEEKKLGTFELIMTYPVSDSAIIAGKFLACLIVFWIMLCLLLVYPLMVSLVWNFLEIAPVLSGYLGIFFVGCGLIACGLFISSLTDNQIISALATMGIFIFLWFLAWNEKIAEKEIVELLKRVSIYDRAYHFLVGVINTRDIIFFLLFTGFFLYLTHMSLKSREWKTVK